MTDRDPLVYLSTAEGVEEPDPEFAQQLLDAMLFELGAEDGGDVSVVQLVDVEGDRSPPRKGEPRFGSWIIGVAAAVLLLVGAVIAFNRESDDGSSAVFAGDPGTVPTAEADPTPIRTPAGALAPTEPGATLAPSAEEVAVQFMQARAVGDAVTLRSLVADDANIANEYAIAEPDDFTVRTGFEQAMGFDIVEFECSELATEVVSCLYSFETDLSRALRIEPYSAFQSVFTIRDGVIRDVVGGSRGDAFGVDFDMFVAWLADNHPQDFDTLDIDEVESNPWLSVRLSEESTAMVQGRLADFTSTVRAPLLKALAEDTRFTFVLQAMLQTPTSAGTTSVYLAGLIDDCVSDEGSSLFAPTDTAIERFLDTNDLERQTLLDNAELTRDMLMFGMLDQAIVRAELAGLEEPTEFDTLQGEPITITGGTEPTINGASLADPTAIDGCNGVIHPIDEVIIPSSVIEALGLGSGD